MEGGRSSAGHDVSAGGRRTTKNRLLRPANTSARRPPCGRPARSAPADGDLQFGKRPNFAREIRAAEGGGRPSSRSFPISFEFRSGNPRRTDENFVLPPARMTADRFRFHSVDSDVRCSPYGTSRFGFKRPSRLPFTPVTRNTSVETSGGGRLV